MNMDKNEQEREQGLNLAYHIQSNYGSKCIMFACSIPNSHADGSKLSQSNETTWQAYCKETKFNQ